MSGAAIILHQNKLMRRFRQAGATSAAEARRLEELPCRNSWIFRRLVSRGVFVETKPGRYYMDEQSAAEFVRQRRSRMLWVLAIVIVLCLLVPLVMSVF